jgi:beta-mannosidase
MVRLRPRVRGGAGELSCTATVRALAGAELPSRLVMAAVGASGRHDTALRVVPEGRDRAGTAGLLLVSEVELWWPHTHGTPALWEVEVTDPASGEALHRARLGFRTLQSAPDLAADGPALRINGEPVFARGAVWTPTSLDAPVGPPGELERILETVVAGGMNMLRVPGTGAYEGKHFYDMCDALGILVWQDFMFANLDYPESDPAFMALVQREVRELLQRLGGRPSLAVLCGGSEVAQQVAMLGLDPALASGPLYGELLPSAVAEADVEAPYVPSAPWGGDLPFRTNMGVANYYGVGAYLRPLSDARLAEVRFASECLAFANVPDEDGLEALASAGDPAVGGATWKSGVPRDVGAGWDFEDVRDHYFRRLFELDPVALRSSEPDRYLDLSRAVSGEVMAETFGEWRRAGSPCRGAIVLWLKDLLPGAGWGVLDHRGEPKVAYHHLRRALAPVAVWSTDEGLGGIAVHVANDGPTAVRGRVRVALYRDFELLVAEAEVDVEVGARGAWEGNVESLLGHFVDVNWAYRFGAPAQDLIVLSLERDGELLSQAFRFPVGRPVAPQPEARLGLRAHAWREPAGAAVRVSSDAFAHGVRLRVPGYAPRDDAFGVEPGHERVIELTAVGEPPWPPTEATLTALNLFGRLRIEIGER